MAVDTKACSNNRKSFDASDAARYPTPIILRALCALHAVLLGACGGALLMGTYMVGVRELQGTNDACLYPLGGGLVVSGGNFPQTLNSGKQCETVRRQYLEKQYDKDVEAAISTAWAFFNAYDIQPNRSQIAVFDIDETALSNRAEWLTSLQQGILPNVWHGAQAQNSSAEDFLPKHLSWSKPEDIQQAPQENAPALKPTLALYKELYRRGFSVTFITGRTDSGGSREATAKALLRAGYGARCSDAMEPPRSSGSAKAQEREELSVDRAASVASRRLLEAPGAHASGRQEVSEREEESPCYVELGMRKEGDRRLASVYKPEQRAKLQGLGYTILASFGDQWSDLSGTSAARASFLLPNPFYYLL